jgi:hypothetical protein
MRYIIFLVFFSLIIYASMEKKQYKLSFHKQSLHKIKKIDFHFNSFILVIPENTECTQETGLYSTNSHDLES